MEEVPNEVTLRAMYEAEHDINLEKVDKAADLMNLLTPELKKEIEESEKEIAEGNCTICHNVDELKAFLDSL